MTDITMPQLSDAMEEGTIVKWLIEDGEQVLAGAELVEIETDKATMAYPSDAEGTLEIVVPEGDSAQVGELIARIGEPVAAVVEGDAAPGSADAAPAAEIPEPHEVPGTGDPEPASAAAPDGPEAAATPDGATPVQRRDAWFDADGKVAATPVAKRYGQVHGVDLGTLAGTGPRGRIVKNDVLRAAGVAIETIAAPAPAAPAPQAKAATTSTTVKSDGASTGGADRDGTTRQKPTRLQQVIARRMVESKTTVPHFQVQTEVVMDEAIALRGRLKALVEEGEKPPSFNDLIVRACAIALRDHPLANGSWVDDAFELHERINVGIAVAADGGLVVPTIFDTDQKSLGQIGAESRRLAAKVRDNEISPGELGGGTFTVSNLGMYGMTAITPVVNPPQAAILGVGVLRDTLARVDGEIVDRSLLTLTLSCDHRILYGADAALFLKRIKDLLEQPLRIAL